MVKLHRLYVFVTTFVLMLYVVLCDKELIIETASYVYFLQLAVFTFIVLVQPNNRYAIFSPSYLSLFYLNLNFIIGHYTVSRGLGLNLKYHNALNNYESIHFIVIFLLLCNLAIFVSIPFKKLQKVSFRTIATKQGVFSLKLAVLFMLIFVLGFIQVDLSFIGGGGDFAYVYKLVIAIFIVLTLAKAKSTWKYPLYILLILLFTVGHFDSKREIIYVIILIVFLEIMYNRVKISASFKQLALVGVGIICFFYIVIISSIMRGYGNYSPDSLGEAASYVPDYVQSDLFMDAFTANFETNSVYGNSTNAINYIHTGYADITYGSTFLRFLFLPLPQSLFPDRPSSMIHNYTKIFAPEFRAIGGSYPVIVYAEVFWNFHVFGLLILYFIFLGINKLYFVLLRNIANNDKGIYTIFLLFMYVTLLQFIRGSGFDIWLVYGLLSLPLIILIIKYRQLNTRNKQRCSI